MTLIQPPLMVNGATHSARVLRMMTRNLAWSNQGVIEGNDLKVRQLTTPGAGVRVGDGAATLMGAMSRSQGAYTQTNVGDSTVPIAPTGASARNDLLVLRVQDPEYEGVLDPAKDDIGFFDVIPGVSSTATTAPAGMTAIGLARIQIPANTATITDGMIKDVRKIANPRRERRLLTAFPNAMSQLTYSDNKWHTWPTAASWSVTIPPWAATATLMVTIAGLRMSKANVFARMQTSIGGDLGQDTYIDDNQGSAIRRQTVMIADTVTISAGQRGTTQSLKLSTYMYKSETGDLSVDVGTSIVADLEFVEGLS
ncbi:MULTISPECIES: hypothetical protein [unclassified Streptomyces]|uniref:hypothetical protein n=1 Tax=unclassified Streptomyces TaxID=2593676 RepID=UPI002E0FF3E9|nr:hypothetical protein OG452_24815 [Streptomyces sp. NBC_01197]WSS49025.1 hypothetical protein OG708_10430 [Streptomyces sp. NBC_01180]